MAAKFLLSCECGSAVAVEAGLAGDQVTCDCGRRLEVPTLGELRRLPQAPSAAPPRPGWGARQGLMALAVIVAILCALPGVYWWWQANMPANDSVDAAIAQSAKQFESMTPSHAWSMWQRRIVPLARHGLDAFETPDAAEQQAATDRLRRNQTIAFSAAGVAAACALLAALWRKPAA